MKLFFRITGIIVAILSILLLLASPVAGIVFFVIGGLLIFLSIKFTKGVAIKKGFKGLLIVIGILFVIILIISTIGNSESSQTASTTEPVITETIIEIEPQSEPIATEPEPVAPPEAKPEPPQDFSDILITPINSNVYIGKTGNKYHRQSCRTLSGSGIEITLSDAKRRGLTPCGVCNP